MTSSAAPETKPTMGETVLVADDDPRAANVSIVILTAKALIAGKVLGLSAYTGRRKSSSSGRGGTPHRR
jgi:hypothetical protein